MNQFFGPPMTKPLLTLQQITSEDVIAVGGKAAHLAKMLQDGLPVPAGFAVSLDAFNQDGILLESLKPEIERLLDTYKLYAVRSSALAEDTKGASWAGQFESFLDTIPKNVITKIEECHNSAKERARAYAKEQATDAVFDIAVVVQEMVKPE